MRIAIFDSGLGGLSVLKAIGLRLPEAQFLYFGDTARLPYGSKSPSTIQSYTLLAARFLAQMNPDAVVIACHTASAWAADLVRNSLSIPVFDMIGPTIRKVICSARTGAIGVLGTRAMIGSNVYQNLLKQTNRPVRVQACPLFVPIVEEGLVDHAVSDLMAATYLGEFRRDQVNTVILGCTHYSALQIPLKRAMNSDVEWIDPAEQVAEELACHLGHPQILGPAFQSESLDLHIESVFVTDDPMHYRGKGAEFLGQALQKIQFVCLESSWEEPTHSSGQDPLYPSLLTLLP
jgi:glutamate racemase